MQQTRTPAQQAARQAQAERLASEIWSRTAQLEGADAKVAGQLTAAAGDVGNVGFANPNGGQNSATKGGGPNGQGSANKGLNGHANPGVAHGQPGGVQLVDFPQDGGTEPAPMPQPTPSQRQPQIGPFPVPHKWPPLRRKHRRPPHRRSPQLDPRSPPDRVSANASDSRSKPTSAKI